MILSERVRVLLEAAIADGLGSAAVCLWQRGPDRQVVAVGRTARAPWPNAAVTGDTLFDLASLTKPIATSTLLVQTLATGRIALGDRLDAHLPDAVGTQLGAATIGQLLSHTSGAHAWQDEFAATSDVPPAERAAAVRRRVLTAPLSRAPGQAAVYSDLGFMALGWLLEHNHALPLDTLFAQRVAQPLGVGLAFRRPPTALGDRQDDGASGSPAVPVAATEIWPPRCADGLPLCGVVHDDNCAALDGVAGHAGLFGSAVDVAGWAECWRDAVAPGSSARDSLAFLPQGICRHLVATAGVPDTTWRHGWDTPTQPGSSAGDRAPLDAFGHLGFTGTSVWFAPSAGGFVVLLTNRVHPSRESVAPIRRLRPALHDLIWADWRSRRNGARIR